MMFMVIERFRPGEIATISKRFAARGRMLPDGLTYHESWVDHAGNRCFQLMETARADLLNAWIARWNDLIDFEIVPVLRSAEFWNEHDPEKLI